MLVRRYYCDEWDIVLALVVSVTDELYIEDVISVLGDYDFEYEINKDVTIYNYGDRCCDKALVIFNTNRDSKIDIASTIFMD